MQNWQPWASVTHIGSMPHKDRQRAIELVLREAPEIPVWPQLPSYRSEQMMVQYLEGLPGIRSREDRIFLETDTPEFEQELYAFYEEYLEVESESRDISESRFRFGTDAGKTFFQFVDAASRNISKPRAVKGQVVGPFTLLAGLKDQNERALLYDERLQDVVAKHLAMKAKWQIPYLKRVADPVIIFLDEPALAGFGSSAFISVSSELVQQLLRDAVDAIHRAGALAGIHVCANTDWNLAFDSGVDIINFDAYSYFDRFLLYGNALPRFFEEGRIIAWGVVPTSDPSVIMKETPERIAENWFKNIQQLTATGMPLQNILAQSIFSPSCGCGSLPEPTAEHVFELTREVGRIMRRQL